MTSGTLDDPRVGYPCLYPNCTERRRYTLELVEHVETDHSTREVLERMVIRDRCGNILALPPHCIYRYFPEVGLAPNEVHEILENLLSTKDKHLNDPLLCSGAAGFSGSHGNFPAAIASGHEGGGESSYDVAAAHNYSPSYPTFPVETRPEPLQSSMPLSPLIYHDQGQFAPVPQTTAVIPNLNLDELLVGYPPSALTKTMAASLSGVMDEKQREQLMPMLLPKKVGPSQNVALPSPLLQKIIQETQQQQPGAYSGGGNSGFFSSTNNGLQRQYSCPTSTVSPTFQPTFPFASTPSPSPDSGRGSVSSVDDTSSQISSPSNLPPISKKFQNPDDNSNDSWMQREDYSIDSIVAFSRSALGGKRPKLKSDTDKPYMCPVPGCAKAYKNMNGIKYHARYAHRIRKPYRCSCNRKYVSEEKLTAHQLLCTIDQTNPAATSSSAAYLQRPLANPGLSTGCNSTVLINAGYSPTLHQLLSKSCTENGSFSSLPSLVGTRGNTLLNSLLEK